MASTQKLTQLPTIQYTGMDYSSVISEIQNIIESNKNWKENWTQFYSSEAGTMLVQLMAWICDNLAVRQDLLYNENYIATATTDEAKLRLLKQIGYFLKGTNGAVTNILVEADQVTTSSDKILLSNNRTEKDNIQAIKNSIFRFKAPDINGKDVNWEILSVDSDGNIDYTQEIKLLGNSANGYTEYDKGEEKEALKAVQGETKYLEFYSETNEGVTFNLGLETCDTDTICVIDLTSDTTNDANGIKKGATHIRVNSFQELAALNLKELEDYTNIPCYILERNDDGYLQIRYPGKTLMDNNSVIKSHGYKAGHRIGVFVRTSSGTDGNIVANYINVTSNVKTENGNTIGIRIRNTLSAQGGRDQEELSEALQNAPIDLRTNNRAVTIDDFDRVLQNNSMVLNSFSYSPDNEPDYFENYYGRKIQPHEVFSFISANKNFANIPADKLNYFPWIDTVKENVFNEYYNFFDSGLNQNFDWSSQFFGGYLTKSIDTSDDTIFDNDKYYSIDYKKQDDSNEFIIKKRSGNVLKNGTIYKTSTDLGAKVSSTENEYVQVKVHLQKFDGNYIRDITNTLFDNDSDFTFTVENNVLNDDKTYHATFTSKEIDPDSTIDVKQYSKMNIILNDNITLTVDLLKENNYYSNYLDAQDSSLSHDEGLITNYYLKYSNEEYFENNYIQIESNDDPIGYYNSEDIAQYRRGILQLMRDALVEYNNNAETISNMTEASSETGALEDDDMSYLRTKNKLVYADAGLQFPETYTSWSTCSDTSEMSKYPFFKDCENSNDIYTIKIGDEIYAIRIDSYSVTAARNFYITQRSEEVLDSTGNRYFKMYDIFNYIGCGKKLDIANIGELTKLELIILTNQIDTEENRTYYRNEWAANDEYQVSDVNDYIESKIEAAINTAYDEWKTNNINTIINSDSTGTYSYRELKESTAGFENAILQEKYLWLTVDRLAALLQYLFSPYNKTENTIFKYNSDDNTWKDIVADGTTVLDGKLLVSCVKKQHYSYNSACTKYSFNDSEYQSFTDTTDAEHKTKYFDGSEYDIRFDYVTNELYSNDNPLTISSVTKSEIGLESNGNINIDNYSFSNKDFFEELFGFKKEIKFIYTDSLESNAEEVFKFDNVNSRIVIQAPNYGNDSSLYINGTGKTINSPILYVFGGAVPNAYNRSATEEPVWYTNKAFGTRRLEMYVDPTEENAIYLNGKLVTTLANISNGDFVFTDNDINLYNTPSNIYISYRLDEKTELQINKRENFCYYDDDGQPIDYESYCTYKEIEPMVAIAGGTYYTSDKKLKLNKKQSDFSIKITQDKTDLNNFYKISENTLDTLNSLKSDNIVITTATINPINAPTADSNEMPGGDTSSSSSSYESFPLRIVIDAPDPYDIDGEFEDNSSYYIIETNISNIDSLNATTIYSAIQEYLQNNEQNYNEAPDDILFEQNISTQRKNICRFETDNNNKLVFTNLKKSNGSIVFCYPKTSVSDQFIKSFYYNLFGTNKTNSYLYQIYPKEVMDENIIVYKDSDEYYYAPCQINGKKHNVVFEYRALGKEDISGNRESRAADYYIKVEDGTPTLANNDDKKVYNFYICRTDTSDFPDTGFYVHYIHDRTNCYEDNLEENVLQKYMKKYMIAGTDMNILKPHFKTFDISATIIFNANYSETVIKNKVETALKTKYQINNIKNVSLGNKIYLSDVTMEIMNIDGVEHVEIKYFGFDSTDSDNYPSQTKYLTSGDEEDFYTMIVLANTSNGHGLILSYQKEQES